MTEPETIAAHGLTTAEYERIVAILGRHPNLLELGIFSVMWSEHCSYKSSRIHLRSLPTEGARVLQGPGEKRRRPRHRRRPGRRVQDRVAQPPVLHRALPGRGDRGGRHHPRHLHDGRPAHRPARLAAVRIAGVAGDAPHGRRRGGRDCRLRQQHRNSDRRRGGRLRRDLCRQPPGQRLLPGHRAGGGRDPGPRGGRRATPSTTWAPSTGRDGIHGATMASAEFDDASAEKRPNVQVGDPFLEKLLLEACLEVAADRTRWSGCRTWGRPG